MLTDASEDYARGYVPFLDCTIYLDSRPLIPRTETEYWTEQAIKEIAEHAKPRVLDLFAGSGAIGVAVLKHVPETRVDFGEIDSAHFPTIRKNIFENGIEESRTAVLETNVLDGVHGAYDFILANPPYISEKLKERVQKSVLLHEPDLALFADEEGFALTRRLIEGARAHLTEQGVLYIEHEPEQTESIQTSAKNAGFTVESLKDQYGVVRFSRLACVA